VGATALKDLIAKGPRDVLGGPGKRLRTVAANAVAGALTSGAVPLVRSHLDQEAEKHKIRAFLKQPGTPTPGGSPKVAGWVEYVKLAAGAPTRGGFMMASEVPAFRHPDIQRPMHHTRPQQIVEKMGSATTPAGRLSASRRVGLPKVTAPPGPAIADTVPTFGQRLPGANKTTIGKMGG
jgi:hypothetical protein